jgi:putative spermidine/putrescine transport system ATP-binding protein
MARNHSLRLQNVSKHFGRIKAVDNVNLTVPRGQFITLLGPSGSGKTTILNMIAGFNKPTSGEILLDEQPITPLPPEKRNFGMVFQGYALFPHMSVADNVAFPLKMRHRPADEIKRKVKETLELVQLTGLADRLPHMLSGGQQQRVALARALVFTPDILLLDEPLGALDRKLRADVQIELKLVHQRVGTTFVYVTHDQEEALSMSSCIAIIREGRFVQVGNPNELYERPATRFVADFLGKSNFIRGTVAEINGEGFTYRAGSNIYHQASESARVHPGADILISIRPEKIAITEIPPQDAVNRIAGEIRSWNYFGSNFQSTVQTANLGNLTVIAPAWRNPVKPAEDRKVWLNWDPDASVIVTDD